MKAPVLLCLFALALTRADESCPAEGCNGELGTWSDVSRDGLDALRNRAWQSMVDSLERVPEVQWDYSISPGAFVKRIAAARKPVILKGGPVTSWPAMSLWLNDSYLVEKINTSMTNVQVLENTKSVFRDTVENKYFEDDTGGGACENVQYKNASIENLLGPREPGRYYYFNLPISSWLTDEKTSDLGDLKLFELEINQKLKDFPTKYLQQVWFATPGVYAGLHYDTFDNFYTQIRGTKSFLMSPPKNHEKGNFFPFMHPCFRQSQFDQREKDKDGKLNVVNPEVLKDAKIAHLQPGDILFQPAMTLHSVLAGGNENLSISTNVFSGSPEFKAYDTIFQMGLPKPIAKDLSEGEVSVRDVNAFFTMLARIVLEVENPLGYWWSAVGQPRYSLLAERHGWQCFGSPIDCGCDLRVDPARAKEIIGHVKKINGKLRPIEDKGIRAFILANYIDALMAQIVETPAACAVLACCVSE